MTAQETTNCHRITSLDELLEVIDPLIAPQFRGLSLSVYLEAGRTHEEAGAARIRFKSELQKRRAEVKGEEALREKVAPLLEPAESLLEDRDFWEHQDGGMAYLADQEGARVIQCARRFGTTSLFGGDLYLLPLLEAAATARRFYLLGLSEGNVFLSRVSDLGEERIEGISESFEEALSRAGFGDDRLEEKEFSNQNNRATEHSLQALRKIEEEVRQAIPDHQTPLLVAAVPFVTDDFVEVCRYPNVVELRLEGDPARMPLRDLADEARTVMGPSFAASDRKRAENALSFVHQNPDLALTEPAAIAQAASNGNIARLTLASGSSQRARYEGGVPALGEGELPPHACCDVPDYAARQTLATGGEVVLVGKGDLPADTPMVAEARWTPASRGQ